jgi:hypothetical protein
MILNAGRKYFSSEVVSAVFDSPFYCNWLFDVEIFIRLKKKGLLSGGIEQPLQGWKDIGGSKNKPEDLTRPSAESLLRWPGDINLSV